MVGNLGRNISAKLATSSPSQVQQNKPSNVPTLTNVFAHKLSFRNLLILGQVSFSSGSKSEFHSEDHNCLEHAHANIKTPSSSLQPKVGISTTRCVIQHINTVHFCSTHYNLPRWTSCSKIVANRSWVLSIQRRKLRLMSLDLPVTILQLQNLDRKSFVRHFVCFSMTLQY